MSAKILPCPMCGKPGKVVFHFEEYWGLCSDDKCATSGPAGETERAALKAWNTRATPPNLAALRELVGEWRKMALVNLFGNQFSFGKRDGILDCAAALEKALSHPVESGDGVDNG